MNETEPVFFGSPVIRMSFGFSKVILKVDDSAPLTILRLAIDFAFACVNTAAWTDTLLSMYSHASYLSLEKYKALNEKAGNQYTLLRRDGRLQDDAC